MLMAHIAAHFAAEEAILERHGYAKIETCRHAHARLLARARELREQVCAGRAGLGTMVEFLAGEVVARHLFGMDRGFFSLIATAGREWGRFWSCRDSSN